MTGLWGYFWPIVAIALLVGAVTGLIASRRPRATVRQGAWRPPVALIGAAVALAGAFAWHGPAGGAARLASEIEARARTTLDRLELPDVGARLHRAPMSRRIELSGPADDFQRAELVKIMRAQRGVTGAGWDRSSGGLPLFVEGTVAALIAFCIGVLLANLAEMRRRAAREWRW